MATSKLKIGAVSALIVAAVTISIAWQRNANTRLRQELSHLREENMQLGRLSRNDSD